MLGWSADRPIERRGSPTLNHEDATLRDLLQTLDPKTRDDLRNVLIRDQADRDAEAGGPDGQSERGLARCSPWGS
jgi:hypothetical protein